MEHISSRMSMVLSWDLIVLVLMLLSIVSDIPPIYVFISAAIFAKNSSFVLIAGCACSDAVAGSLSPALPMVGFLGLSLAQGPIVWPMVSPVFASACSSCRRGVDKTSGVPGAVIAPSSLASSGGVSGTSWLTMVVAPPSFCVFSRVVAGASWASLASALRVTRDVAPLLSGGGSGSGVSFGSLVGDFDCVFVDFFVFVIVC